MKVKCFSACLHLIDVQSLVKMFTCKNTACLNCGSGTTGSVKVNVSSSCCLLTPRRLTLTTPYSVFIVISEFDLTYQLTKV